MEAQTGRLITIKPMVRHNLAIKCADRWTFSYFLANGPRHMNTLCRVIRRAYFSSAVRCFQADLSEEENQKLYGPLFTTHGLGHNYILESHVEGPVGADSGMVLGISQLDSLLKEVTASLDHRFLNYDLAHFQTVVPTAENIAQYCYLRIHEMLNKQYPNVKLFKIRLYETEDFWVDCGPGLSGIDQ